MAPLLDADTTIKPLYGHQEGAAIGYNPRKPGRPSHAHHAYLMAGLRQVLGVEVRPDNEHTAKHAQPGLLKILDALPRERKPRLVRGDDAFGNDPLMTALEERGHLKQAIAGIGPPKNLRLLEIMQTEWGSHGS